MITNINRASSVCNKFDQVFCHKHQVCKCYCTEYGGFIIRKIAFAQNAGIELDTAWGRIML